MGSGSKKKELGMMRRVLSVIFACVGLSGVLVVLCTFGLLIFGAKTEGRLVNREHINHRKYRFTYVYTVDGEDYEFTAVKKVRHEENTEAFRTQKISYLASHPSTIADERSFGIGFLLGGIGAYGWALARYGVKK